jgi:serine/threonine protein kinase
MLPLPTSSDYQDAIQNPKSCFDHPELQRSRPEVDKLGLPRPFSGSFAVVFPVTLGNKKWGVRCFTTYHPDQELRYERISQHLSQHPLPYTVPFEFISRGIKVRGNWHPILKMEWVDGESLLKYVEKNLDKPQEIQKAALQFRKLTCDLKGIGIAHGDLQHGNIIMVNGCFRLVDYDGMFVPGLEGLQSNELGHPNYQHPKRTSKDFGPYLDNYSAWCIYVSLMALAADPGLWHRIGAGDEHICFRKRDFEDPDSSPVIRALEEVRDDDLRKLVDLFKSIIYCPELRLIPSLDGIQLPGTVTERPIGSNWLLDHLKRPSVHMPRPSLVERVLVKTLPPVIVFNLFFVLFSNIPWLGIPLLVCTLAFTILLFAMIARFRNLPENSDKAKLSAQLRQIRSEADRAEGITACLEGKRKSMEQERDKKIGDLDSKLRDCMQRNNKQLDKIDNNLRDILSGVSSKRHGLNQQEANELADSLQRFQVQFLASKLSAHNLSDAKIPGIGQMMTQRLSDNGVRAASDILDVQVVKSGYGRRTHKVAYIEMPSKGKVHVYGIGPEKAQALLAWRRKLEGNYKSLIPNSLPSAQENAIRSKYLAKRRALDAQEARAKESAVQKKEACMVKLRKEREDLERQLSERIGEFRKNIENLERHLSKTRKFSSHKRWEASRLELDLKAFSQITLLNYLRSAILR